MYKTRAKRDKKGKIIHEVLAVNESIYKKSEMPCLLARRDSALLMNYMCFRNSNPKSSPTAGYSLTEGGLAIHGL